MSPIQATAREPVVIAPGASSQVRPVQPRDEPAKPRAIGALYFSPVVRIDPKTAEAIWEIRDPTTGNVLKQYPSARDAVTDKKSVST